VLAYLGGATAVIGGIIYYFSTITPDEISRVSSVASSLIMILVIISFIVLAMWRKVNVYETFIDGAKDGFTIAVQIIPYLVAILVAIGVFRASGSLEYIVGAIATLIKGMGFNADFVEALPTAFMKPLSGSAARAMNLEIMKTFGPDSFVGRLSSIFRGATETTFYILAVYFGSVNIKNTRYAVPAGLFADLVGIIAGIFIGYLFFHNG
jgi:spore maturation protein SpmB